MKAIFSSVANTVTSYTKVYSLTSDDNEMPSAPQMKELSDITFESGEDSEKILELLLKRIAEESPYIRTKALRLMKYICQRGRPEFRADLARQTDLVRQCLRASSATWIYFDHL